MKILLGSVVFLSAELFALPNICTVVNTPQFDACTQLSISPTTCGFPPRPCVNISYYVPSYFVEVVANPAETYFSGLPGVSSQLSQVQDRTPTAAENDHNGYSYHAHSLAVPLVGSVYRSMPCGGTPSEPYCLGAMSEHLGMRWKTGSADSGQPQFLLWAASPKACLLTGAASSAGGGSPPSGSSGGACSYDRSYLQTFPPSAEPACNGWGVFYPRYQTVITSDQTTASLMIAARFKSLSAEVFHSMQSGGDELYQMIYPQPTACFRQGQNVALLRLKGVNEVRRGFGAFSKNYLYAFWRRVSCTKDMPYAASTPLALNAIRAACRMVN